MATMAAATPGSAPRLTRPSVFARRKSIDSPSSVGSGASSPRPLTVDDVRRHINGICHVSWTLMRVSPLHRFGAVSLDAQAAHLSACLKRELSTINSLPEITECTMTAISLDLEHQLSGVHLKSTYVADTLTSTPPVTLQAVFLRAVGADEDPEAEFSFFPLLMIRCPGHIAPVLHRWLTTRFDCHLSPMVITPGELSMFAGQWAESAIIDPTAKPLELTYQVPEFVAPHLQRLALTVEAASVHRIARTLDSEVPQLLRAIEEQFSATFQVPLTSFRLVRMGSQVAFVTAEGKAKFYELADPRPTLDIVHELIRAAAIM